MQTAVPFTVVDCCPAAQLETVTALADGEIQVATAIKSVATLRGNARFTEGLSLSVYSSSAGAMAAAMSQSTALNAL